MNYQRLASLMIDCGVPNTVEMAIDDAEFMLPSLRWLEDVFAPAWLTLVERSGWVYRPGTRDCDDFARKCSAYAQELHAMTVEKGLNDAVPGTALAFGFFAYEKPEGPHALNIAVTPGDGWNALVVLFEPQPLFPVRVWPLTIEEARTCFRYSYP